MTKSINKFVPVEIDSADIYRDGGSYGIRYYDKDRIFYEMFIKVKLDKNFTKEGYEQPRLLQYANIDGQEIASTELLSWECAEELFDILLKLNVPTGCSHQMIESIKEIIGSKGCIS